MFGHETYLPRKNEGILLSVLPKDQTSYLFNLFSILAPMLSAKEGSCKHHFLSLQVLLDKENEPRFTDCQADVLTTTPFSRLYLTEYCCLGSHFAKNCYDLVPLLWSLGWKQTDKALCIKVQIILVFRFGFKMILKWILFAKIGF